MVDISQHILTLVLFFTVTGDATYYSLGLTACGRVYRDTDLVAAVAFSYFKNPNPNNDAMCGKRVLVTDPKTRKSVTVTVVDKCQGCKVGDIDLSPTAFTRLRELGVGRFRVNWNFI